MRAADGPDLVGAVRALQAGEQLQPAQARAVLALLLSSHCLEQELKRRERDLEHQEALRLFAWYFREGLSYREAASMAARHCQLSAETIRKLAARELDPLEVRGAG